MSSEKWRYGVIFDAGSSGTRVHIYRWLENSIARTRPGASSLPQLESKDRWTKKTHPGVSTFAETPELIGPDHLEELLDHALKYVPQHHVADTPIFVLGTAGMRLLPTPQREALRKSICDYIRKTTQFIISDCNLHVQVISGETEGLYGWVAANYLLGGLDAPEEHDHGKGHHTYGFLDMGGASAQIAFAPNATEIAKHANDLTLVRLRTIDGASQEYRVFVTTWLGFGANEARRRYVDALLKSIGSSPSSELPDPCLPSGLQMTTTGEVISETMPLNEPHLLGTGKFDECLRQTYPLLDKDAPCLDDPCLLNGVHVPAIDFDVNHFIGISEYWHTTHEIFEMGHKDKSYDFNTYQNRVQEFCEQDWATIEKGVEDKVYGTTVDEQTAYEICFKASWLINMLHNGIGIPRVGIEGTPASGHNGTTKLLEGAKGKGYLDPFQAVNKIKSTEVSWTLGKMVLYASSAVPVQDDLLPVGFGSNVPGIPEDFQFPGGGSTSSKAGSPGQDVGPSLQDQIHETLFHSNPSRRIPGFILFVFIILLAMFYLCGRDRRTRLFQSVLPGWPMGSHRFSRKRHGSYERVLEEGPELHDPGDFELSGFESDEADEDNGKSSGMHTPRRKEPNGMLTPDVLDKTGLAIRIGSSDRLALARSRTGSPTRLKGP